MTLSLKTLGLALSLSLLSVASFAGNLPEGSFKGDSDVIKARTADSKLKGIIDNDVMALILKQDPSDTNSYYAILADYDRIPGTNITRRAALVKWVNRMYAYRATRMTDLLYKMEPISGSTSGEIVINEKLLPSLLKLKKKNSLDGAVMTRLGAGAVEETIAFKGRVGSTWEGYVPGKFFGSHDATGGDYKHQRVNMDLSKDGVANFYQEDIKGLFSISERGPGMFTLLAKSNDVVGREKVEGKIAVFIDIVNWKHLGIERFTTEELLIVNPDNAADVGFYYERH